MTVPAAHGRFDTRRPRKFIAGSAMGRASGWGRRGLRAIALLMVLGVTPWADGVPVARAGPPAADLALRHGAIYPIDAARRWAEALAIRDGRIVYVGSDRGLRAYLGPRTRIVDLHGRMVLPGFEDAHIHPIDGGLQSLGCDLSALKTADQYVAAVRRCALAHPEDPWIVGTGWWLSAFGAGGRARRELLDAVVPDRPVYLLSTDGHTVWANTRALEQAHITAATPDPPDGRIDRDPVTGEPTGTLQEGASAPLDALVPPRSAAERAAALESAVRMLNGYGITAIQDAAVREPDLVRYRELERRGRLSVHVVAALWWEHTEGVEQIARLRRLRDTYRTLLVDPRTVKIMQDGSVENATAVLLEPYLPPGSGSGTPMVEPGRLKEIVAALDRDGFQVHFHAIGDGAVREALDAVEAARERNGDRGNRHQLAHLELVDPVDVARFRELGAIADFQPLWAFADDYVTQLTRPLLGDGRMERLYPIGSLVRSGAVVAFGSDWPVSTANPFEQIQVALTRMNPEGGDAAPFLPGERITLPEALAAFTIGSAFANRLDRDTGSLEVGKRADLVVLDQNLFAVPVEAIGRTHALVTLFGGRVVHGDLGALETPDSAAH